MDINKARNQLEQLKNERKYDAMIYTASIVTQLLDEHKKSTQLGI